MVAGQHFRTSEIVCTISTLVALMSSRTHYCTIPKKKPYFKAKHLPQAGFSEQRGTAREEARKLTPSLALLRLRQLPGGKGRTLLELTPKKGQSSCITLIKIPNEKSSSLSLHMGHHRRYHRLSRSLHPHPCQRHCPTRHPQPHYPSRPLLPQPSTEYLYQQPTSPTISHLPPMAHRRRLCLSLLRQSKPLARTLRHQRWLR